MSADSARPAVPTLQRTRGCRQRKKPRLAQRVAALPTQGLPWRPAIVPRSGLPSRLSPGLPQLATVWRFTWF